MNEGSLNIKELQLKKLQAFFPETITEGKVDWEKFQSTLGEDVSFTNERYVLNWAGKSDAFRAIQTPSTATLVPGKSDSINFEASPNLFIEGENLETLKIIQRSYYGKVKMIYIDPPYNTGNDSFIYPDKFSETKEEYLKRIGSKDENGYLTREGFFRKNAKDNGQYHSNWLSMMYPRLFLARNLLKDDGVIFVSIDDNEVHNLRLLMNEIFGEENFIATVIWKKKYSPQNDATYFSDMHDYILCYAKQKKQNINDDSGWALTLLPRTEKQNERYCNPDNDLRGNWKPGDMLVKTYSESYDYEIITPAGRKVRPPKGRCWRFSRQKYEDMLKDNRIWFGKDGNSIPAIKRFLSEVRQGVVPSTIWEREEVGDNQEAAEEIKSLFGGLIFDTPKPVRLISRLLQISTSNKSSDIILDFFSGSATTAQAVFETNKNDDGNRSFICVQIPETISEGTEAYKSGFRTIADIGKTRIKNVLRQYEDKAKRNPGLFKEGVSVDLGFKFFRLRASNFKTWRGQIENETDLMKQLNAFKDPVTPEAPEENIVYELMLKTGYKLTANVETRTIKKQQIHLIESGELVLVLSGIDSDVVKEIIKLKPQKVIALDRLFQNNDQLKTNTALQMKDAGIDFKSI